MSKLRVHFADKIFLNKETNLYSHVWLFTTALKIYNIKYKGESSYPSNTCACGSITEP